MLSFKSWLRSFVRSGSPRMAPAQHRKQRLRFEVLEERCTPSTTVTFSELPTAFTGTGNGFNGKNNEFLISSDGAYKVEAFFIAGDGYFHFPGGDTSLYRELNDNNAARANSSFFLQGIHIARLDGQPFTLTQMNIFHEAAIGHLTDTFFGMGNFSLVSTVGGTDVNPPLVVFNSSNFSSSFLNTITNVTSIDIADPYAAGSFSYVINGITNAWDNLTLKINNDAPVADAGGPYTVPEGGTVGLSATATDTEGDALQYSWDLDNNGTFETSGQNVTFSAAGLDGPGSQTVRLKVSDFSNTTGLPIGNSTIATATVNITNVAPTATISAVSPINEGAPTTVSLINPFDPSNADLASLHYFFATSAAARDAATYGTSGTANSASVPTTDNGVITVYARVLDKDGGFSDYDTPVIVNNVAPTATLSNSGPINEGSSATATFSNPSDPSSVDTTAGFHYSFAQSAAGLAATYAAAGTSSTSAPFTYNDNGNYTIYGRIFDKDGGFTDSTTTVVVNNVAPTATLSNSGPINEGSSATATFSGQSDPSSVDIAAGFHYSFAQTAAGLAATYAAAGTSSTSAPFTFNDNGSYIIYGRIFDKDGGFTDSTTTVVVNNVAPTATLSNSGPINEGSSATAYFSNPSDPSSVDTTAGFHYSFAQTVAGLATSYAAAGTSSTSAPFTYNDNGSYTIYGRIFDKDGGFTNSTTTVVVNNVAPIATFANSGPINEGSGATAYFTNPADPSSVDTTAGFHYSFAQTVAGLATSYAAAGTSSTSATFTYNDNGIKTIFGRIFDKDGGFTDYQTNVTVNNVAPTATITNNGPINEGTTAVVNLTNSADPSSADISAGLHYVFSTSQVTRDAASYGSGSGTATSANFPTNDNGTLTVYARIIDKDGGYTDYQTTITINNVAPTATFTNNGPINAGSAATISFSNPSDPSSADTAAGFHYSISQTSGGLATTYAAAGTATSVQYTFPSAGSYVVFGRIFDKDNGFRDYTTTVVVNAVITCPLPARITDTTATVSDYINGTATNVTSILYNVSSGKINNVAPGVFFYYVEIKATTSNFSVLIDQTHSPTFVNFGIQQMQLYNPDGSLSSLGSFSTTGGDVTCNITGAAVDQLFVIRVKYNPGPVVGYSAPSTNVVYTFTTMIGADVISSDSVTLKKKGT